MKIKAVIFDLDETLLDRDQSLRNFVGWQCRGMLRPYVKDEEKFLARFIELDSNGNVWKDKVYETLRDEFSIGEWSVAELLSVYENCFCGFSIAREGVRDALLDLSRSHKIGLISNGMSPFQERNFRCLGLSTFFQSVIVSQAVNLRKPDARIFHQGCEELRVEPSEAAYVGDNPVADIRGASDAGLLTVFIPTALHPVCSFADAICEDMGGLPAVIEKLARRTVQ
jgi:putative hydrolase of the HAD superfamily